MRWRRRLGSRRMPIRGCRSGRFGRCSRWWMGVSASRGWRVWPLIWGDPATTWIRRGGLGGSVRFGILRSCLIGTRCIDRRWFGPGPAGRVGRSPADGAWQAELWRRLRARIGIPDPAERVEGACARLREEPGIVDLPARLSLFGLTRLPAGHLNVLRCARGRAGRARVHAASVAGTVGAGGGAGGSRSLGGGRIRRRRCRRIGCSLLGGRTRGRCSWFSGRATTSIIITPSSTGRARFLRSSPGRCAGRPVARRCCRCQTKRTSGRCWTQDDRSVQVHACHGRARQVEVLSDAILHLLDDDPTLEPRDVIVMCPDIETFAPLIQATFGAGEVFEDDDELEALPADVRPPDLRVRLADRALRQTNPVLGVVGRLLDLVDERLTASQVLDFADQEPVRRRFGLDDDDLARHRGLGRREWHSVGTRRRAPNAVQARGAGRRDVAGRGRPAPGRRHDDRGGAAAVRRRAPARRRRQRRHRPRRPVRRARRPAAASRSTALSSPKTIDAWAAAIADAADALTDDAASATPGSAPSSTASSATWPTRRPAAAVRRASCRRRSGRC